MPSTKLVLVDWITFKRSSGLIKSGNIETETASSSAADVTIPTGY